MTEWNCPRTDRSLGGGGWHRRQRRRLAAYRVGGGGGGLSRRSLAVADLDSPGSGRLKEQWNSKSVYSDSNCSSSSQLEESSESSDQEVDGGAKRVLMPQQILKEVVDMRTPPGIIARLMGLDELPPPEVACKRQVKMGGFLQNKPYFTGVEEKRAGACDRSFPLRSSECRGSKHTVQDIELKAEKDKNMEFSKAFPMLAGSQLDIICNSINSLDEKDFSSDESLKSAIESNGELVRQYSNNDHFVNAHKGTNSFFRKNLHDAKWLVPSNQARLTTMRCSKLERSVLRHGSERPRSEDINRINCFLKSAKLQKEENSHLHIHTCPVVVLKPFFESHRLGTIALPLPQNQNGQLGKRRQMTESRFPEKYAKRINRWIFSDKVDHIGEKRKSSRQIAEEVTNYMRYCTTTDTKNPQLLGGNMYLKNENFPLYGTENTQNSSSLLTSPIEPVKGKRARNKLHERSRTTNQSGEAECYAMRLKTLSEMLALSNKEISNVASKPPKINQISDWESGTVDLPTRSGSSSSATNRYGWNDWNLIKLPKSTLLPTLPFGSRHECLNSRQVSDNDYYCNAKLVPNLAHESIMHAKISQRGRFRKRSFAGLSGKLQPFSYEEDECKLHQGNVLVYPEESMEKSYEKAPESDNRVCSDDARSNAVDLVAKLSTLQVIQKNRSPSSNKELAEQKANNNHEMKNIEIFCNHHKEIATLGNKVDYLPDHLEAKETEPETLSSTKDTLQPSPVSVLEPAVRSGGLHIPDQVEAEVTQVKIPEKESTEFHVQLQFLESDSEDTRVDGSEDVRSHDDVSSASSFVEQEGQIIEEFIDEEERDFTYLLDILIDSGFQSANQSELYSKGCSQQYPLSKSTLEKLEKKYRKLILRSGLDKNLVFWSRSERKLLFDFLNCILAEILAPCTEAYPWANHFRKVGPMWGSEGLVEKAWQLLVRKRDELSIGNPDEKVLDGKWLELVQYVDVIGREMEEMLLKELLEQFVSESMAGLDASDN